MKVVVRNILVCFLILSPAPCRAVSPVTHNFHTLATTSGMTLNPPSNTIGVTDFVTYTCSSGAKFWYGAETGNEVAVFLVSDTAQVVTTLIQNLDSMVIYYSTSTDKKRLSVAISPNGLDSWVDLELKTIKGSEAKSVKLPSAGDYCVRIKRNSDNMYIKQIDYYCVDPLSGCPNCFIYRPE